VALPGEWRANAADAIAAHLGALARRRLVELAAV